MCLRLGEESNYGKLGFWALSCTSDAENAGQQSRDVYEMALYHKEHEIACVRLHGGWPARVGVGSCHLCLQRDRLVSERFRLLLSDTTIPAEK
jgi:hypothetical protein